MTSCSKEDSLVINGPQSIPVNQDISGTARILKFDPNIIRDSTKYMPLAGAIVYYADSSYTEFDENWINDPDILSVTVDASGTYSFIGVPPAQGKALFIDINQDNLSNDDFFIYGVDTELDGDMNERNHNTKIHIDLELDEKDLGNNFTVQDPIFPKLSIVGSILVDADLDGIGDYGYAGSFNLYKRLPNGVPPTNLGNQIKRVGSTEEGRYRFSDIEPGEYVIRLDLRNNFTIISSGDDTPDPDGLGNPDMPRFIPVDLVPGEIDSDNNFIIRLN